MKVNMMSEASTWLAVTTSPSNSRAQPDLAFPRFTIRDMVTSQRKLLDIAMALLLRPRLLILDEPTSGVSTDEKHGLMATIIPLGPGLAALGITPSALGAIVPGYLGQNDRYVTLRGQYRRP